MTKGDQIRQMSNEELAEAIAFKCEWCMADKFCDISCIEGIKAYLDMEVEE